MSFEKAVGRHPTRWSTAAIAVAKTRAGGRATIGEWCSFLDLIDAALLVVRKEAPIFRAKDGAA